MIRSSKHTILYANKVKLNTYDTFLKEYRRVAPLYLDVIWDLSLTYTTKKGETRKFNIKNQQYDTPQFISTTQINIPTTLSSRAIKCLTTQLCGEISAVLEKPRRRFYRLAQLKAEGQSTTKLEAVIKRHLITKPVATNINPELNSLCCDIQNTDGNYNAFIQLKSLGKTFGQIKIPIKYHRQSNKWLNKGKRLNSFMFSDNYIGIRYKIPNIKKRSTGKTLGADQGLKTLLTFSDGTITNYSDIHGHSLESIIGKLSRKKKGSKTFGKTQEHRLNFINASINSLNFSGIKQINLEQIINIGYKNKQSRKLQHWTNTLIRDKLEKVGEEEGFLVNLQSSTYRSQRCSSCGMVRKSNRKGKLYVCKCGLTIDADLNAALNHSIVLPDIPYALRKLNYNRKGFYWTKNGFYNLAGEEITVPLSDNKSK